MSHLLSVCPLLVDFGATMGFQPPSVASVGNLPDVAHLAVDILPAVLLVHLGALEVQNDVVFQVQKPLQNSSCGKTQLIAQESDTTHAQYEGSFFCRTE